MESPGSTAGPRVYVPISHPDSPVPTYAVLQFLGISPPPDPSSQTPLLQSQFSPSMHLLSCSPVSNPASPASKRCASSTESSNSSSSDEKEKRLTSIKPSPMKKSASGSGLGSSPLSPVTRRNGKVLPLGPTISITHTDKDTIIHTHSSNFREVVHQLTGATSGDKGLMPVTLPSRAATNIRSGAGNDKDYASPAAAATPARNQNGDANVEVASVRKQTGYPTTKLLERRNSNKVLDRLFTSCRNLPPLVPSPVTPLASDFEKISFPVTPTTSEGSLTPVLSSSAVNMSPLSRDGRAMETLISVSHEIKPTLLRSHSAKAMQTDFDGGRTDAIDVQGPRTPHVMRSQSLRLHDGMDVLSPSSPQVRGMQSSNRLCVMDGAGPSLALATGAGESSAPEAMDVQNGQEITVQDAMDAESLCDGKAVQDSSATAGADDTTLVKDEESVIAKEGFFFHSQRTQHGGPTLLALFPESPREL